jgi:hypothetical protein
MFHDNEAPGVKISGNPMDTNWGGSKYSRELVKRGFYANNEVSKITV